eukprot:TRINITY_DN2915_c0_g1_i1.p1 TRINITY_DN2915_c0_g1~~TRINITY_DN2915_c0_g1_i1.p1  ORF type:complete len:176 (-),score=24.54 TRINITY_DN2915_c0_g1_i1:85-612(-)
MMILSPRKFEEKTAINFVKIQSCKINREIRTFLETLGVPLLSNEVTRRTRSFEIQSSHHLEILVAKSVQYLQPYIRAKYSTLYQDLNNGPNTICDRLSRLKVQAASEVYVVHELCKVTSHREEVPVIFADNTLTIALTSTRHKLKILEELTRMFFLEKSIVKRLHIFMCFILLVR